LRQDELVLMRATIDAAGRLVVPKVLRDELGFAPGTEVELTAVDGHLEVALASRVRIEEGRMASASPPARATG